MLDDDPQRLSHTDLVRHVLAAGSEVFPDLVVERAAIEDLTQARLAAGISAEQLRSHAAELYLGAACASHPPAALAILDRIYIARVPEILANRRLPDHGVDEVRQTVRERLLGGQPPYLTRAVGRGSLVSLVAVIATRAAVDWLRARARATLHHDPEPADDELVATGDPARDHLRARYRGEVKAAFEAAASELSPRERTLLRLHLVDGLTIDDLARLYQIHRATAARQVDRARERVASTTRKLLGRTAGLHGDELAELGTLVTSQLDLSLSRVLA
ncbi:MAG: putative DNA-binding regulatory protein [Deltaproteobacteria bacterium]|nr:putative DNA-binding regulatory protein [Deltaproteobacteria bacterium]